MPMGDGRGLAGGGAGGALERRDGRGRGRGEISPSACVAASGAPARPLQPARPCRLPSETPWEGVLAGGRGVGCDIDAYMRSATEGATSTMVILAMHDG